MENINATRRHLLRVFQSQAINEPLLQQPHLELEEGISLDDLDSNVLLQLTIPFIIGVSKNNKEELISFIRTVLKLDIDSESMVKSEEAPFSLKHAFVINTNSITDTVGYKRIFEDILEGKLTRENKIRIGSIAKFTLPSYIEWECKSFMKNMIEACLCIALLQLRSILNEEEILERKRTERTVFNIEEKEAGPQIYNVLKCGHLKPVETSRKDLLKRRITPTKTIDEYVASLQDSIKPEIEKKPGKEEMSTLKKRLKDDFSDLTMNFRGNTKNVG